MMIATFALFLAMFTLVGLSSAWSSRGTKQDYYLASGAVPAWLVGLSAVATNNSGYMFIGVIGYTYVTGLASIWLMAGWIAGDFLASLFVHKRLNAATTRTGEVSYAGVLAGWHGTRQKHLQRLIGAVSLLFLLAYASAQLVAGSKALQVLFDWPHWAGAVMGAALVVLYCLAGGIRASIWTDAAQSCVMVLAMALLLWVAVADLGGPAAVQAQLNAVPQFMDWFPRELALPGAAGAGLFALSWVFAGLSVIGQPHVMVRFMALNESRQMLQARLWYYLWFTGFYCLATGVGLLSRLHLPDTGSFDAELALPSIALTLLPAPMVGLILAGIFAATLSTADSLLLSCSAALTHDLLPQKLERPWMLKLATALITMLALAWALLNEQSVFNLVIMAWSGLASAFAPLLLVLALGGRPRPRNAIAALVIGLAVALAWRALGWQDAIYEGLPGIVTGLLVLGLPLLRQRMQGTAAASA